MVNFQSYLSTSLFNNVKHYSVSIIMLRCFCLWWWKKDWSSYQDNSLLILALQEFVCYLRKWLKLLGPQLPHIQNKTRYSRFTLWGGNLGIISNVIALFRGIRFPSSKQWSCQKAFGTPHNCRLGTTYACACTPAINEGKEKSHFWFHEAINVCAYACVCVKVVFI